MSEEDYQRGLRGGESRVSISDWQRYSDWKEGSDEYERQQEAEDEARLERSRSSGFVFPGDLIQAVQALGFRLNKVYDDSLSYYAVVDGSQRLIVVMNNGEYLFFSARTRFQFDSESDFPRELLYKALCENDKRAQTYLAIAPTKVPDSTGAFVEKLVLTAWTDRWKPLLQASWLPNVHSGLIGMCDAIEASLKPLPPKSN